MHISYKWSLLLWDWFLNLSYSDVTTSTALSCNFIMSVFIYRRRLLSQKFSSFIVLPLILIKYWLRKSLWISEQSLQQSRRSKKSLNCWVSGHHTLEECRMTLDLRTLLWLQHPLQLLALSGHLWGIKLLVKSMYRVIPL